MREETRASTRERERNGECAGGAGRRGGVAWRGRARMVATRHRDPNKIERARGAAVAASGRRESARRGETGPFRWLGRLDGADPPVNSAPFLFF